MKRMLLTAVVIVGVLSLAVAGSANAAEFSWRKYAGTTITVNIEKIQGIEYAMTFIPEFESLTGIKVILDAMPSMQARQKRVIEFQSKSPSFDVFLSALHVEKVLFANSGWFEPLDSYINDPTMTNPGFDINDFGKGPLTWMTAQQGIVAISAFYNSWGLMARTSALKQAGLAFPKTLEELAAAVKKTHSPPKLYGWIGRGVKNENVPVWTWLLHAFGGDWFNKDGELDTASPAAIKGAKMYSDLMQFAPPGSIGYGWVEVTEAFTKGLASFLVNGLGETAYADDPTRSSISGDVTYGYLPVSAAASGEPFLISSSMALALSPFSKKKGAGWYFIQWATSKEMCRRVMTQTGETWSRVSTYSDPAFLKAAKAHTLKWIQATAAALEGCTYPLLPFMGPVGQFRDEFGLILTNGIANPGGIEEALKKKTEEWRQMLGKQQ